MRVIASELVLQSEGVSLDALASALRRGWRADTAWIDDWNERNPARGQCGSTALVVQDLRGGTLMTGVVLDGSNAPSVHYWNVLAVGDIDLTRQQFSAGARVRACKPVGRSELLCSSWFVDRYQALRDRVDLLIDSDGERAKHSIVELSLRTATHSPARPNGLSIT